VDFDAAIGRLTLVRSVGPSVKLGGFASPTDAPRRAQGANVQLGRSAPPTDAPRGAQKGALVLVTLTQPVAARIQVVRAVVASSIVTNVADLAGLRAAIDASTL
jgi:hypothetical protein